ncbi:MAG: amidohydrolase [Planctomycetes bacterium]|nr:amidohydrolase [Planctomycetota bacterium]
MTIVDSHVHVWQERPLPDLLAEMEKAGVQKAIIVGAVRDRDPGNNEQLAECVSSHPGRLAALADIPLKAEDAPARVEWASKELGLHGISHYLSPADSLDWFLDETRKKLWSFVEKRGLAVSLSLFPGQHPMLGRVAEAYPGIRFMLCHIARPDRSEAPPYPVFRQALASARYPGIFVKISGFYAYTERSWDYPYHDVHRWVRMVLEAYGPERMCWGSDFSPVLRHSTYRQSLEIVRTHAAYLTEAEKEWVLGKAALNAVPALV